MRFLNKNQVSLLLISGSLLLLIAFLSSWLKSTYEKEKISLQREIHVGLSGITKNIEDSLVHKVFIQNLTVTLDSGTMEKDTFYEKRQNIILTDDTKSISFLKKELAAGHLHSDMDKSPGIIEVRKNWNLRGQYQSTPGLLPILIHFEQDSLNWTRDSTNWVFEPGSGADHALNLITQRFDKYLSDSNLPESYNIVDSRRDSVPKGITMTVYHDPSSSNLYGARFEAYRGYLLRKMTPEIFFSVFLFSAICASFFIIYFNWRRQQQLIEIKNDFISNVTHELKTPIATVGVALEALSNFEALSDPKKTEEYLGISKHELNRLNILVDKVLKMSIFENDASKLRIVDVDLKALVEEILTSFKLHFDRFKAQIQFDTSGHDFHLEGDRIHLTNVIYNLIDNALKYSNEQPKLNIKIENHPDQVHLHVMDNGMGIPKQYMGKIFDRFFRVPTRDIHNVKGHGLGLSYVANVIKKHNGHIEVESQEGKGTAFHISLPRKHATH